MGLAARVVRYRELCRRPRHVGRRAVTARPLSRYLVSQYLHRTYLPHRPYGIRYPAGIPLVQLVGKQLEYSQATACVRACVQYRLRDIFPTGERMQSIMFTRMA